MILNMLKKELLMISVDTKLNNGILKFELPPADRQQDSECLRRADAEDARSV